MRGRATMAADTYKADWELFQEKIRDWQKTYMERLVKEYAELLQNGDMVPCDRFWELDQRIQKDKKSPGVQLRMEKENMYWDITRLIQDGVITFDDLEEFSDELKDIVERFLSL